MSLSSSLSAGIVKVGPKLLLTPAGHALLPFVVPAAIVGGAIYGIGKLLNK